MTLSVVRIVDQRKLNLLHIKQAKATMPLKAVVAF